LARVSNITGYANLIGLLNVLQQSSSNNGKLSITQGMCNDKFCDVWKAVVDPATAGAPTDAEMVLVGTSDKTNQVVSLCAGARLHDDADTGEFTVIADGGWTRPETYYLF
jgi:hypothetical protein